MARGLPLEALIITAVLIGSRRLLDAAYTGDCPSTASARFLSVIGMGGLVVGVLVWQEGGESVAALLAIEFGDGGLAYWLVRRKRAGKLILLDPTLFASKLFRFASTRSSSSKSLSVGC